MGFRSRFQGLGGLGLGTKVGGLDLGLRVSGVGLFRS